MKSELDSINFKIFSVDQIQKDWVCSDACKSTTFTVEESMSSFSELSVNNLLDQGTTTIQEKYQAAQEIRERIEPERLAGFLNKHRKITSALTKYLGLASYISSNTTTSIRVPSIQMMKLFFTETVQKDMKVLFEDVENYRKAYETMYLSGRSIITKHLAEIEDGVTHYMKLLYEAKWDLYDAQTFKTKISDLPSPLFK